MASVDLRDWIVRDLRSLRGKLDSGVLGLVPPERRRERADGGGIAPVYVLWHLARHQDVAVNGVLRSAEAVLERWTERLGVRGDLWRGLAEGEDSELVDMLDPEAVGEYALAVCDASTAWLDDDGLPALDAKPDAASALAAIGAPEDRFDWLYSMWDGKPSAWFLQWSAVGHGFNHLGELVSIRNRMGLSPF